MAENSDKKTSRTILIIIGVLVGLLILINVVAGILLYHGSKVKQEMIRARKLDSIPQK